MARTLSATALAAMYAEETDEVPIILVTIDHPDFTSPVRVTNESSDVTSNGNVFLQAGFDFEFPSNVEGQITEARITIDNVDRVILQEIRGLAGKPTIQFDMVLASAPNTVEISSTEFILSDVIYDKLKITGRFSQENFEKEPYPGDIMAPSGFPGLYG